jgi:release factor glutamine methyltransferase
MIHRNPPDPDLSHIQSSDYEFVYEPGDDTFLLMSALDNTLGNSIPLGENQFFTILEIGPGTGIISAHAQNLVKYHRPTSRVFSIAVELNPIAAEISKSTFSRNRICGDLVLGNLSDCLNSSRFKADVLIFNPPYVPSPCDEIGPSFQQIEPNKNLISAAWAGGDRGRFVIDQFIPTIEKLLAPNGVLYLVLIRDNDPDEIISILNHSYNIASTLVNSKPSVREHLVILKCHFK